MDINTTITGVLKKLAGMIFVENTNKLADSQTEKGGDYMIQEGLYIWGSGIRVTYGDLKPLNDSGRWSPSPVEG